MFEMFCFVFGFIGLVFILFFIGMIVVAAKSATL